MTIFRFKPEDSVFRAGNFAFSSFSPFADELIVDAGTFLISPNFAGANLDPNGGWKVIVNGTIVGGPEGINLLGTTKSTITIGSNGQVGGDEAISSQSPVTIDNAGSIVGATFGIFLLRDGTVTNSGTITGGTNAIAGNGVADDSVVNKASGIINGIVGLSSGNDKLTNQGIINGNAALAAGNDELNNSGTIVGNANLGNGTNKAENSGKIDGDLDGGDDDDTIVNSGEITGAVALGGNTDQLTNSGQAGDVTGVGNNTVINSGTLQSISFFAGLDSVTNNKSGVVIGVVDLGGGDNMVKNSGMLMDDLTTGMGTDTIANVVKSGKKKAFAGTIEANVDLGGGDDTFTNYLKFKFTIKKKKSNGDVKKKKKTVEKSGEVDGTIDLGDGDDTFNGGNNAETVKDGNGADTINLKGGNDTYIATGSSGADGVDTIDGGNGIDTYDASGSGSQVLINLSTSEQDDLPGDFANITPLAASTAIGNDISNGTVETVENFENAFGGIQADVLFGSDGDNTLKGNGSFDDLYGLGGNDRLEGGENEDFLVGGLGADILLGGADGDKFWYFDIAESGTTAATRDLIEDFTDDGMDGDLIDLTNIDADTSTANNDAFSFIGTNVLFSGAAGELRAYWSATGQIIEGDVDGDGAADFSIEIVDPDHLIALSAANNDDFVL